MKIEQAKSELDWTKASNLLLRVVERLNELGRSLWTFEQVSIDGLKGYYQLNELYYLVDSDCIGVVFLQEINPFFWPEVTKNDSLYVHKLAIDPVHSGKNLGQKALHAIVDEAKKHGYRWVRLDCDDRPELHSFYQDFGFELVDIKQMGEFQVARYQLLTSIGRECENAVPFP